MSKISYQTYVKDRLSGFQDTGAPPSLQAADLMEFPEYTQRWAKGNPITIIRYPSCTGPLAYTGTEQLARDLGHLKAAVLGVETAEVFMNAPSPGIVALVLNNQYYSSYEEYLSELAEAMKTEYDAIYHAGFLLQLDSPDLALITGDQGTAAHLRALHVEVLNHATRDIPADRMRLHMCWGNYEGPHHYDVPLRDLIDSLLQVRPSALVLEASNPRHAHEWQVFEEVKLPQDKLLVLGVLDTTTNFIEHPELVAQRLVRMARLVGRERVIAGADCGFATVAGMHMVDPQIAWAKLQAMAEGARLASQRIW